MTQTSTTATHTVNYVTTSNGAPAKGRRFVCSCGRHGARFAFGPAAGRTLAQAQAKAEKDAASHIAGEW